MPVSNGNVDESLRISQLYLYPIKSLRPTKISKAEFTKHGFPYDRTFMLLKDEGEHVEASKRYRNMAVASFPEMSLFLTDVRYPSSEAAGSISVTFAPPDGAQRTLTVPLQPDTARLSPMPVNMHGSPTSAFDMGDPYNVWFAACFGFAVRLLYIGANRRAVLFQSVGAALSPPQPSSWLTGISSAVSALLGGSGSGSGNGSGEEAARPAAEHIAFHDCAPFLFVTQQSCDEVTGWLPAGEAMDVTKFRPNVVLRGGGEGAPAWDEDFWGEVTVCAADGRRLVVPLLQNCIRCQSLNIDFATGKPGTGKTGEVLKMLQKTRRVDKGKKYHAVFGRYGYLKGDAGTVSIGDEVQVTRRNEERTAFGELLQRNCRGSLTDGFIDWPGL